MSVARLAHLHASATTNTPTAAACRAHFYTPCTGSPNQWLRPRAYDQHAAAAGCTSCPLATPCLLTALRLDAAHRRGEDPYGAYGVYGGVWFSPGEPPRRIRVVDDAEARAAHAACWRLRAAGQHVPEEVAEAERVYQRNASRRHRTRPNRAA